MSATCCRCRVLLPRGARAARSVARISEQGNESPTPIGTGFLVGPTLLLTNNHVLPAADAAAAAVVEFGVELDLDNHPERPARVNLDPAALFFTDVDLDVTLVAVGPTDHGEAAGHAFGWNPLIRAQGKIVTGEALNIIGHPAGRPKEIAIRNNQLLAVLPQFLQYSTDTQRGSSGSPVYNDQWEVVGLHHAAVPKKNARGRVLRKDGTVWQPADGPAAVWWRANEGVRISAILELFDQRGISVGDAAPTAAVL